MPQLCPPTTQVHLSFLAAMAEFQAEGRGGGEDNSMIGRDIRDGGGEWSDPGVFSGIRGPGVGGPGPRGRAAASLEWVPSTTLWWVDGADNYLGRISIRHRLTPTLLELGRPHRLRRAAVGPAAGVTPRRCWAAARPVAARLGIDPVLVTCDLDNTGSRKVIEANGGVLEDQQGGSSASVTTS